MPRLTALWRKQLGAFGRALLIGAAGVFVPVLAHAHFILITPDSWMSQDSFGLPEKLGPCGDEGGGTPTGKVTPLRPGQTISVTINEVIPHPGHYRVALAINDRGELPAEPMVTPTADDPCASAAIQDPPTFPILADNVVPHTQAFSGPQTFTVTLPADVTCASCTLQVLEFMSSHSAPCFYHHCADISIQDESGACGDGQLQPGEQCDDGNTASGDGCDSRCRLECASVTRPQLTIGKLNTPPGDDTLRLQGTLRLPFPENPAVNPPANGVRLQIDAAGTVLDLSVPGGTGWMANKSGTIWMYWNKSPTLPGGIYKVVIRDESAISPGLVKFAVNARAGSFAVASANLPTTARMTIAPASGQCGDANFPSCAFNASRSRLRCK